MRAKPHIPHSLGALLAPARVSDSTSGILLHQVYIILHSTPLRYNGLQHTSTTSYCHGYLDLLSVGYHTYIVVQHIIDYNINTIVVLVITLFIITLATPTSSITAM